MRPSHFAHRRLLFALGTLAVVSFAPVASAQAPQPVGSDVKMGDPFDAASVATALRGMRVFKAKMNEVAALTAQYLDTQRKRSAVQESSERQREEYRINDDKFRECIGTQMSADKPERDRQMQQKMMTSMSDQKFVTEYTRILEATSRAMAASDTASARTLQGDLMKLLGVDPRADTAAAVAKCGARPARPAAMIQIEQMEKRIEDINKQMRLIESSADIEGARAAGVTPAKFGQMRERLTQFANNGKAFVGKEGEVLKPHKAEIEALVKTP